jgi:hypothetical protein
VSAEPCRPYVRVPDALFASARDALGPRWYAQDADYTAAGVPHFCVRRGAYVFVPLETPALHSLGREMTWQDTTALHDWLARELHRLAQRRRLRDDPPSLAPRTYVLDGTALPVLRDDATARHWRWCPCCLGLFHTALGRTGQRYCSQPCGTFAHAWVVYHRERARYTWRVWSPDEPMASEAGLTGWRVFTARWYARQQRRLRLQRWPGEVVQPVRLRGRLWARTQHVLRRWRSPVHE